MSLGHGFKFHQSIFANLVNYGMNLLVQKLQADTFMYCHALPVLELLWKVQKYLGTKIHTHTSLSILCCFRCSFSTELFPLAFIDYDGSSQSNKGDLQNFNSKCHWTNGTSPSSDWIIWYPGYCKKYDQHYCSTNPYIIPWSSPSSYYWHHPE